MCEFAGIDAETRYVVSSSVRRLDSGDNIIYLTDRPDTFYRVSPAMLRLLDRCRQPVTGREMLAGTDPEIVEALGTLVDAGVVVQEAFPHRKAAFPLRPSEPTAFGVRSWTPLCALEGVLLLIGASSDERTLRGYARGTRDGPNVVRKGSMELPAAERFETWQTLGWYDYETESKILVGAQLLDAGNLEAGPGLNPNEYGEALTSYLRRFRSQGAKCVLLGGDHSLTLAAVDALPGDFGLVYVDAHSDLGPWRFEGDLNHGNVLRWILNKSTVRHVVHFGLRGINNSAQTPGFGHFAAYSVGRTRQLKQSDWENIFESGNKKKTN